MGIHDYSSDLLHTQTMSPAGNISLNCENHYQTLHSNLMLLWNSEEFLDVTLACDDDQVRAHKVILSAASPFFRKLLLRNPHNHPLIFLKGASTTNIQSLLHFIYSGETSVNQSDLESFMSLASSLKIDGLAGEYSEINKEDRKPTVKKYHERSTIFDKDPTNTDDVIDKENADTIEMDNSDHEHVMDEGKKEGISVIKDTEGLGGGGCEWVGPRRPSKSEVWNSWGFKRLPYQTVDYSKVYCKLCDICQNYVGTTTNMKFHLASKHSVDINSSLSLV